MTVFITSVAAQLDQSELIIIYNIQNFVASKGTSFLTVLTNMLLFLFLAHKSFSAHGAIYYDYLFTWT